MFHNEQVGVKSPVFSSRKLIDNALPFWFSFHNKDIQKQKLDTFSFASRDLFYFFHSSGDWFLYPWDFQV